MGLVPLWCMLTVGLVWYELSNQIHTIKYGCSPLYEVCDKYNPIYWEQIKPTQGDYFTKAPSVKDITFTPQIQVSNPSGKNIQTDATMSEILEFEEFLSQLEKQIAKSTQAKSEQVDKGFILPFYRQCYDVVYTFFQAASEVIDKVLGLSTRAQDLWRSVLEYEYLEALICPVWADLHELYTDHLEEYIVASVTSLHHHPLITPLIPHLSAACWILLAFILGRCCYRIVEITCRPKKVRKFRKCGKRFKPIH